MHTLGVVSIIVLALVLGLIGSILVIALENITRHIWQDQETARKERNDLSGRIIELEKEVIELKEAGPKRHTHSTLAGIEDALAIAIDVLNEYAESQRFAQVRMTQLQNVLKTVRSDPNGYDQDKPAGLRPERRNSRSKDY
jgi:hypothetical protein